MIEKVPSHFLNYFEEKKVSMIDIIEAAKKLEDKGSANWKDLVWYLLQELNLTIAINATNEQDFLHEQHSLYLEMLYLRRKYEGKKANEIIQLLHSTKAQIANCSSLKMKAGISGEDKRCDYSFNFKDKWFRIEDALEGCLIDYNKCTNPVGCTCSYIFKAVRDKNNNLIPKEQL